MKFSLWLGKLLGVVPHGATLPSKATKEATTKPVARKPAAVADLIAIRAQRKRDKESGINAS